MAKNKHSKIDWESNHRRIILYADIMGFKAKLKSTSHNDIVKELRKFVKDVSRHLSPYQTGGHLRMTLFSDLVVIAADRLDLPNYKLIVGAASALMLECHKKEYPINGCISCGSLTFDAPEWQTDNKTKSNESEEHKRHIYKKDQYMPLFVGQSVVDSYLLCENLFCYGIVLHPSAEKIHKEAMQHEDSKYNSLPFEKIPVPIKSGGVARLFYFKWNKVKLANNSPDDSEITQMLNKMEQKVDVRPRAYIHNTLEIMKLISSSKKEFT